MLRFRIAKPSCRPPPSGQVQLGSRQRSRRHRHPVRNCRPRLVPRRHRDRPRATRSTASSRTGRWTTGSRPTSATGPVHGGPVLGHEQAQRHARHRQNGYKKITGPIGRQLIHDAHERKDRVELVYTSFGYARNKRFFGGKVETQDKVIRSLVDFADEIGVDGINVDVELLDAEFVPAYGAFVGPAARGLREKHPKAEVSVATTANIGGASMAASAATAGADRIFMMAYDYHWPGSAPGASSPLDRRDGDERDLLWSLDLYDAMGVPVDRTLLGLPLYGMTWPVDRPRARGARDRQGRAWFPRKNVSYLLDPKTVPERDPIEVVELYTENTGTAVDPEWRAIYLDSPATLTPKLTLADERGLAGAGFWAVGYERGLPDYTKLIKRFHAGGGNSRPT